MVLFMDQTLFTKEGIFSHTSHFMQKQSHAASVHCHQRFVVNLWAGVVNEFLNGPYLLP
jgi:hypothetical protein